MPRAIETALVIGAFSSQAASPDDSENAENKQKSGALNESNPIVQCSGSSYGERGQMGRFDRFFSKRLPAQAPSVEQAVVIELAGAALPGAIHEQHDIVTLEDLLQAALGQLGVCEGNEHGAENTRIYLYGADAESMFQAIERVLLDYPLAAESLVTVRKGPPGAPQREIRLPR